MKVSYIINWQIWQNSVDKSTEAGIMGKCSAIQNNLFLQQMWRQDCFFWLSFPFLPSPRHPRIIKLAICFTLRSNKHVQRFYWIFPILTSKLMKNFSMISFLFYSTNLCGLAWIRFRISSVYFISSITVSWVVPASIIGW